MFKFLKLKHQAIFFLDPESGELIEGRFAKEASVLEIAKKQKWLVPTSCGGMGTCGTCRIELIDTASNATLDGTLNVEDRNELEAEMAEARGFHRGERLACQVKAKHGLKFRVR